MKQEPQTYVKWPFRRTAQTGSMENWKKGGMGNYAVVTEPITSLCERRLL